MTTTLRIRTEDSPARISRHLHGHFSEHLGRCIYGGFWVGEDSPIPNTRGIRNDVVAALRAIGAPNLRWPGGCFADEYHWMDGIGPREKRPSMINTHWGGVTENNHFGTHEFLDLCGQVGCEPYICGNVGSGTVREMSQWVEYLNASGESPMTALRRANGRAEPWGLTYFGVGNENWGCGGNMRAEYYADVFRRYACYCRNYGDRPLFRIACGSVSDNFYWTEVVMREAARFMDGLSFHYYATPRTWESKGPATGFTPAEWFAMLRNAWRMDDLLSRHSAIMDKYDPVRRVALVVDEWGAWYDVEPGTNPGFLHQQNTVRDALVAGITLHAFHHHCRRVRMANLAQTVNVLQAPILTEGDRMVLTPTYHVLDLFRPHQDGERLAVSGDPPAYSFGAETIPALSASASRGADGTVTLTLCNSLPDAALPLRIELDGGLVAERADGRLLTGDACDAHNTFESPDAVAPADMGRLPLRGGVLELDLPPHAVAALRLQ